MFSKTVCCLHIFYPLSHNFSGVQSLRYCVHLIPVLVLLLVCIVFCCIMCTFMPFPFQLLLVIGFVDDV